MKEAAESSDTLETYWISFLFFSGSMRRSVSLITATFTSSSTRLGIFSNTPGESLGGKDSELEPDCDPAPMLIPDCL